MPRFEFLLELHDFRGLGRPARNEQNLARLHPNHFIDGRCGQFGSELAYLIRLRRDVDFKRLCRKASAERD